MNVIIVTPRLYIGTKLTLPHTKTDDPNEAARVIKAGGRVLTVSDEAAIATLKRLGVKGAKARVTRARKDLGASVEDDSIVKPPQKRKN